MVRIGNSRGQERRQAYALTPAAAYALNFEQNLQKRKVEEKGFTMISRGLEGPRLEQRRPVPRALLLWLLICGTMGPVLFDAVYLIEGVTRPGYDGWQQAISTLSLGPGGWIQQANFICLGVITLGVAVAWRRILKGGVCATWYPILRGIEGFSLIMIGFFSTDPAPGYPPGTVPTVPFTTVHGVIHFSFTFMIIAAMMGGLFVIARRFWGDPNWRGWVSYSVASAVLINVFIVLFGVANTHHFEYAGVFERLATNVEAIWSLVVLARLWTGVPFFRG